MMTSHSSTSNLPSQPTTAPLSPTAQPDTSSAGALAKYIDLAKWEHNNDNHYQWQGTISLADLPRIDALRDPNHTATEPLAIALEICKKGEIVFWQLQTQGTLWQNCQRCLEPVAISLAVDSELALLADENHAALLEEGSEVILLDEIADDQKLWLLPMIEDELLVDLPLAPKHDDCELAITEYGDIPSVATEKDNPFAVLAGLKN